MRRKFLQLEQHILNNLNQPYIVFTKDDAKGLYFPNDDAFIV